MTPETSTPAAPPEPSDAADSFLVALSPLPLRAPWDWLAAGWRDFVAAPGESLFFGMCFSVMGIALLSVFSTAPAYVIGLAGGFLLVGPFLCMGLYHISESLESGRAPRLRDAVMAWRRRTDTVGIFGLVLLVLEMLWARATLVIFALTFEGLPDFKGSLLALLDPRNVEFIVSWLCLGAVFATLVFSVSAVSIPMILDRRTDAITAGLTSFRLVLSQPAVMFQWAAIIVVLTVLAMLPAFAGLMVVGPVLGHASWHAYRAATRAA